VTVRDAYTAPVRIDVMPSTGSTHAVIAASVVLTTATSDAHVPPGTTACTKYDAPVGTDGSGYAGATLRTGAVVEADALATPVTSEATAATITRTGTARRRVLTTVLTTLRSDTFRT
jgi:hypothetical protein